ncbi:MAG: TonB-dependent receptor, partial [Candidatus Eremiobacteraeota bacterium]|nr:TonB-dependent receptor [Candidatus Eremiobacteraeota bacterium]
MAAVALVLALLLQGTMVLAQSTTGNIGGTVIDETGKPVAGATVNAASPSQTGTARTDPSGRFTILSLAPDTYTITVQASGFQAFTQPGVTVVATQTQTLSLGLHRTLTTIGSTTSRAGNSVVRPGVTSDLYNVTLAQQTAVQGLGGGNNIDNAYSAIVSTPGTYVAQGAVGWGQTLFIHGADYQQVGYQYDGIPINRAFDNYNSNTLTNLGQQELQVFTGGAPPDSNSQTVGGYINQVIKTGTYPAYRQLQLGVGTPSFYNQGRFETGGATPSRLFSYYLGGSAYQQSFRYGSQFNGEGFTNNIGIGSGNGYTNNVNYGYGPIPYCGPGGTDPAANATGGDPGCNMPFPWAAGSLSRLHDQEGVLNLHFGIPHRSGIRDDVQLLGSLSHLMQFYDTSFNDLGPQNIANVYNYLTGSTFTGATVPRPVYRDGVQFPVGTLPLQPVASIPTNTNCFSPTTPVRYIPYLFPSSPTGRPCRSAIDPNKEDGTQVDTAITKVQYQHAFNANSFLRVYGYTDYSDWLQNGPYFAASAYGGYLGNYWTTQASSDYELITHTRGASANYVNQINSRNLLEFTANYTTASTVRFNNSTWNNGTGSAATNLVSVANGQYTCWGAGDTPVSCYTGRGSFSNPTPFAAGPNGTAAGAQWLVTKVGPTGTYNTVVPQFYSYALTDQLTATDKLLLNFGLRYEQYNYQLVPLVGGIYDFWYQAAASSLCYDPTSGLPVAGSVAKGAAPPAPPFVGLNCPMLNGVQTVHPNGQNGSVLYTGAVNGNIQRSAFEPRFSGTYTFNRDNVLRFSFGKYSQPVQTAFTEYNNLDPSSLTSAGGAGANFNLFFPYGFTTPRHDLPPAVSYNTDLSFEHQFHNSDVSASFSPFYRRTLNQYQTVVIGPNFASAFPAANQNSYGFE